MAIAKSPGWTAPRHCSGSRILLILILNGGDGRNRPSARAHFTFALRLATAQAFRSHHARSAPIQGAGLLASIPPSHPVGLSREVTPPTGVRVPLTPCVGSPRSLSRASCAPHRAERSLGSRPSRPLPRTVTSISTSPNGLRSTPRSERRTAFTSAMEGVRK